MNGVSSSSHITLGGFSVPSSPYTAAVRNELLSRNRARSSPPSPNTAARPLTRPAFAGLPEAASRDAPIRSANGCGKSAFRSARSRPEVLNNQCRRLLAVAFAFAGSNNFGRDTPKRSAIAFRHMRSVRSRSGLAAVHSLLRGRHTTISVACSANPHVHLSQHNTVQTHLAPSRISMRVIKGLLPPTPFSATKRGLPR